MNMMQQQQKNFQLPNPSDIFRDQNYNGKAKMTEREMQAMLNSRPDFAPPPLPQQVQKFEDVNNAKLFQVQSLYSDLNLLKTTFQSKVAEIEKRLQIIEQPSQAGQNPGNMQPFTPPAQLTHFQPLQTQMQQPIQGGFQQGGFQPFRASAPPNFR